jgi:hypothetical protein
MPEKPKRQVFGVALRVSRAAGVVLIIIAILGLPQMRFLTGRYADSFAILMSLTLGITGVVWLVGVEVFLRFFDRYLSRN